MQPSLQHDSPDQEPIGTAEIDIEGTITLRLRAAEDGAVGQGIVVYRKGHPQYADILQHIGTVMPGQRTLVMPWASS